MAIPNAFSLSLQMQDKPYKFKPLTDPSSMACPENIQTPARHQLAAKAMLDQGVRKAPECPATYDNGGLPHDKEVDPGHGEQPQHDEGGGVECQCDERHSENHHEIIDLEVVCVLPQSSSGLQKQCWGSPNVCHPT